MPLDPSIPLQVQGLKMPDASQMVSLAQAAQEMQSYPLRVQMQRQQIEMQRQEMQQRTLALQQQRAVQAVYADPAHFDENHQLKPEAMQRIMAANPTAGMGILQSNASIQQANARTLEALAQTDKNRQEQAMRQLGLADDWRTARQTAYDDAIKASGDKDTATKAAVTAGAKWLEDIGAPSGIFNKDILGKLQQENAQFDHAQRRPEIVKHAY